MTTLTEKQIKKELKKEKLDFLEGVADDGKGGE